MEPHYSKCPLQQTIRQYKMSFLTNFSGIEEFDESLEPAEPKIWKDEVGLRLIPDLRVCQDAGEERAVGQDALK